MTVNWITARQQPGTRESENTLLIKWMRNPANWLSVNSEDRHLRDTCDCPTFAPAGAILDRFLYHAQTIAITGRSYRLKDHAAIAGKEDNNKKTKSKSNEPLAAEPAS